MRSRFMIENPDEVVCTMKLTMTVKQWTELRDQLSNAHPSWKLTSEINSLISQARNVFYAADIEEPS
jgi:hypothetical protein